MASFKKSSANLLNNLPSEILLEILYKLSVKELRRNKTVCKLWSSLISHPSFGSEYSVRKSSSSPALTLYLTLGIHCSNSNKEWLTQSPRVSLNFLPDIKMEKPFYKSYAVVASSNGLLLCWNTFTHLSIVCNPVTKQLLTLPPPPTFPPSPRDCTLRLVLSGFVCCGSENGSTQFKVVRIVRDMDRIKSSKVLDIEIFDSATNQWRVLRKTLDIEIAFHTDIIGGIEHRGVMYWENRATNSVIAFDPNHDTCLRFPLPGPYKCNNRVLGKSGNHLYYAQMKFEKRNNRYTIWRYDESPGEHTWSIHRSYVFGISPGNPCCLLAIDPIDCNIIYLSFSYWDYEDSDLSVRLIYSLDVANGKERELCSFPCSSFPAAIVTLSSIMFVEPTWPTSLPRLPDPVLH